MMIEIRNMRGVSPTEKLVLFALASHLPSIWPSQSTLAAETGLTRETINRTLRSLSGRDIIKTEPRISGNYEYKIAVPLSQTLDPEKVGHLKTPADGVTHDHRGVTHDHRGCDPRSQGVVILDHTKKQVKKQVKEEKGGADAPARKSRRKFTIPLDWTPSDAGKDYAKQKGATDEEIIHATGEFRAYWIDTSEKRDDSGWSRTWRSNCDRLARFGKLGGGGSGGGNRTAARGVVDVASEFLADLEGGGGFCENRSENRVH